MRAVVWTDVMQTGIYMIGALFAVVLIGQGVDGGWNAIFADASAAGKLKLIDTYTGFDRAHTLWAGLLGGAFLSMASHGADQLIVQRLLASSNLRDARRALIGSGIGVIVQFAIFLVIGIGLHAYYSGREFALSDQIFPTFIIEVMPPGVTGLVVAAILAAAMSTVSGSINSLSAATTHDIWMPLRKTPVDEATGFRMGRRFTVFWAFVLIGGALLYREQGTPVVVVALSIASFTYGGLLGGFFLAVLWKRAQQLHALIGMATGIAAMTFVVFARPISGWLPSLAPTLEPFTRIAWPWYVLIGTSIPMLVGIIASVLLPRPGSETTT
jgi:Na+/proline symporter